MGHFSNAKIHAMNAKRIRMKFKWVLLDLKAIQMNYQAWIILQDGGMLKVCVNLLIIYPWSASQLVGTQEEKTQRSSWHIFTSRKQCCRVNRSNEHSLRAWLHGEFQPGMKFFFPPTGLKYCCDYMLNFSPGRAQNAKFWEKVYWGAKTQSMHMLAFQIGRASCRERV